MKLTNDIVGLLFAWRMVQNNQLNILYPNKENVKAIKRCKKNKKTRSISRKAITATKTILPHTVLRLLLLPPPPLRRLLLSPQLLLYDPGRVPPASPQRHRQHPGLHLELHRGRGLVARHPEQVLVLDVVHHPGLKLDILVLFPP